MQIGQAFVDFEACEIRGPAGNHAVEPLVMKVLSVLVENADQVVTRDKLIDDVWGVAYGGDERLSRAISLLRKSLGDTRGKHTFIQTIPKTGYKLVLETDAVAQPIETTDAAASGKTPDRNIWLRLIPALTAVLLAVTAYWNFSRDRTTLKTPEQPLVMVMDSAHPARIYDAEIRDSGATNADILSDILADLPIRTQKELISPSWHRYEAMVKFDPDLIVIHYSGFKQEDGSGDRPQLRLLFEYFEKTDTEFLVYSRASDEWLSNAMNIVMEKLYTENPEFKSRVEIFPLLEYGGPHWKEQGPAQGIKLKIKDVLELETDSKSP